MLVNSYFRDFVSLFYPRLCLACGDTLFRHEEVLCTICLSELPRTKFHLYEDSPLDKVFWGRVPVCKTAALFYFSKGGRVQHLVHQLKYKGRKEVGVFTGKMLGKEIWTVQEYHDIQRIIPVPLHPRKFKKRGYNQSEQIAIGLSEATGLPVDISSFVRTVASETQTRKARFARFENVKEIFYVSDPEALADQHILLVDDVITTGSTLESCANVLLKVPGIKISIASIAYAVL